MWYSWYGLIFRWRENVKNNDWAKTETVQVCTPGRKNCICLHYSWSAEIRTTLSAFSTVFFVREYWGNRGFFPRNQQTAPSIPLGRQFKQKPTNTNYLHIRSIENYRKRRSFYTKWFLYQLYINANRSTTQFKKAPPPIFATNSEVSEDAARTEHQRTDSGPVRRGLSANEF